MGHRKQNYWRRQKERLRPEERPITFIKKAGIIVLILGLFMTFYAGFTYFTREKVADFEEHEITKDNQNTVNWQPYVGIGIMIIGSVLLVLGVNRKDEKEINGALK